MELTSELKEKLQACKSPEDLISALQSQGIELPDEALDDVAGGWALYAELGGHGTTVDGMRFGATFSTSDMAKILDFELPGGETVRSLLRSAAAAGLLNSAASNGSTSTEPQG